MGARPTLFPPRCAQPSITPDTLIPLGQPRFTVTLQGASSSMQLEQQERGQHPGPPDPQEEAALAAAAFRRLQAAAADPRGWSSTDSSSSGSDAPACGPHRPFMAPLLANRRLTAEGHFQETRHLEFDLGGRPLPAAAHALRQKPLRHSCVCPDPAQL